MGRADSALKNHCLQNYIYYETEGVSLIHLNRIAGLSRGSNTAKRALRAKYSKTQKISASNA
jgi:lambda repressor-like predicted transcriptional regulator